VTEALDRAVVEVDVREHELRPLEQLRSSAKPWFCAVTLDCPVARFFTGWLAPRWPNFSL